MTMTIGERIKMFRKEKGLTQKELAEKLGVSASMIGQYETNVRKPKFETLKNFSEALGINITDLIDIHDISPSLQLMVPLIEKCQNITAHAAPNETIILSDEEKDQIRQLANLFHNVKDELSNNNFLIEILRNEYISLFDKLNFQGKYLAVKMVSDLLNDPDNSGCPLCNPK